MDNGQEERAKRAQEGRGIMERRDKRGQEGRWKELRSQFALHTLATNTQVPHSLKTRPLSSSSSSETNHILIIDQLCYIEFLLVWIQTGNLFSQKFQLIRNMHRLR